MDELPRVMRFVAYFASPVRAAAVQQYMEQNVATFQQATDALNFNHGVDFLLCCAEED